MKLVILTQEDPFTVPKNIHSLASLPGVELLQVVVLNAKGSLINKKAYFIKGFGPWQSARMGLALLFARSLDLVDALCGYRLLHHKHSVRAVAAVHRAPCCVITDPNAEAFIESLRRLAPDLLISFSAPCVFRRELLSVPRLGALNLHCSLLPRYAGLLPSFWVLYHGEQETGATVHYMDDQIDHGGILGQVRIPIARGMSMLELIKRSKAAGGELICRIVRQMQCNQTPLTQPNDSAGRSYFSWPTVEELRRFRSRGGRLI
jgi:folate-dependent phosphoribosylglycinamide formyltransferase PurN